MGVKLFWTEVPNVTPLRQKWANRLHCLAYVSVAVFCRYTVARKSARENGHWKLESSITLRRYRAAVMSGLTMTVLYISRHRRMAIIYKRIFPVLLRDISHRH